jgi:activating signal cointegrator 1
VIQIPAITLWQPWASWIALGLKSVETRGHRHFQHLVGQTIAIHAGKAYDKHALSVAMRYAAIQDLCGIHPQGVIVCMATVVGFRELVERDSVHALCPCGPGRFGLFLADIRPLVPAIPAKGAQGVWMWNREGQP